MLLGSTHSATDLNMFLPSLFAMRFSECVHWVDHCSWNSHKLLSFSLNVFCCKNLKLLGEKSLNFCKRTLATVRILYLSIIHSYDFVNISFNTYSNGEIAASDGSSFCSFTLIVRNIFLNKNLPYSTFKSWFWLVNKQVVSLVAIFIECLLHWRSKACSVQFKVIEYKKDWDSGLNKAALYSDLRNTCLPPSPCSCL